MRTFVADRLGVLQRERRPAHRLAALLVGGEPPAGHFCTWKVCAPSTLISFSMVAWITEIAVITAMIEATPGTMPTRVSDERSLLLRIALQGHDEHVQTVACPMLYS